MDDERPVRACMCTSLTFRVILGVARDRGYTKVEQLTELLGCGGSCGLCMPYLQRMLETGETEFAVIPRTDAR